MYKVPAAPLVKPQPIPSPLTVGGCGIWLDSTDTSAASMIFSSGQNLSVWKDKSGNGNDFSVLQGVPTVINDGAQTVVNFANTGSDATEPIMKSANQITWNASSAFFIVSKLTTTTFAYVLAFSDIGGSDHSIRFTNGNLTGTAGYAGNFDDMTNSYYVNGNFNPNYTSSSYLNKYAIIDTVAPFINNGTTSYLTLSGGAIYQRYFFGNIAEFIYYPAGVSEIQRQQIEGYLAIKWGLQDSLPAGHPGLFGVPPTTMTFVQQPGLIWHDSRVLNRQYPPITQIITNGLLLHLDAGNLASYPGTGNQWSDLTGSGVLVTLYMSPTFSSDNGGYLAFSPASGQYAQSDVDLGTLTRWTLEVWHYYNGTNIGSNPCIVVQNYSQNSHINYLLGATTNNNTLSTAFYNSGFLRTDYTYVLPAVGWYHIVGTYDGENLKLYVNNVLIKTAPTTDTPVDSGPGLVLMKRWDGNSEFWGGYLSIVRIYNRALLENEVDANYTFSKARFGLS